MHHLNLGYGLNIYGQNSVEIGNAGAPDASAVLDMGSTTQGVLIPRMSTTQRLAIASPANGLQVYDNTLNVLFYYNGSSWNQLAASAAANALTSGHVPVAADGGSLANSPLAVSSSKLGVGTETPDAALNISNSSETNQLAVSKLVDDAVQDVFVVDNAGNTTIGGNTSIAGNTTLTGLTGVGTVPTSLTPMSVLSTTSHFASFIATTPTGTSSSTPYCIMANVDYTNDANLKALAVHNTTFDGNPNSPYDAFYVQANGNIYTNGTFTTHNPITGNSLFNIDGNGNTTMSGTLNIAGNGVTMSGIVADTIADTIPGLIMQLDKAGHMQPLSMATVQHIIFAPNPTVGGTTCGILSNPLWSNTTPLPGNPYVVYTVGCQQVGVGYK
ncbi:MAG TPA: hypothetical protein VNZ45_08445, partial [Bacteroidia bacterium]|nr:hypothetical protein [Bacteroidia bacterium]